MPTDNTSNNQAPIKRDFKQEFLESIANQSGLLSAVTMEQALKHQNAQLEEAMTQGGMNIQDISNTIAKQFAPPQQTSAPTNRGNNLVGGIGALLQAIGEGGMGVSPSQSALNYAKAQEVRNTSTGKDVYGFDPATGKLTLQARVPQNADVRNLQPSSNTGLDSLPLELQPAAYGLARKIAGVRGAEKVLPSIVKNLQDGVPLDQIEDKMRYMSQSPEFSVSVRDAAQNMSIDKSDTVRNSNFDALDDYIQRGDMGGAKDYLKRMAVEKGTADQQNQVLGKERTVDFLNEIRNDLKTLEDSGINTGFLKGNYENLLARVGQVKDPGMRKVATKMAIAVMQYRRSMTGVQFGQIENNEYRRLFPNINKVGEFNTAALDALTEAFNGDVTKYYQQSMGKKNYDKIFGSSESTVETPKETPKQSQGWTQEKENRLMELRKKLGK